MVEILGINTPSPVKKAPGTSFFSESVVNKGQWYCSLHVKYPEPEWIAFRGEVFPACPMCLAEKVPEPSFVGRVEEVPAALEICARDGCIGMAKDNQCQFCALSFCDDDMEVAGPQGLCKNCGRD